jgi:uncharacterized protein (TIRG00374 family)
LAPLAAAVFLSAPVILMWGVRSWFLFRSAGTPLPLPRLVLFGSLAFAVNALTPGSTGEVLRAYLLRSRHGIAISVGTAVILVERVVAFFYLSSSAAVLWLVSRGQLEPLPGIGAIVVLAVVPSLAVRLGFRGGATLRVVPGSRILGEDRWQTVRARFDRVDDVIVPLVGRRAPAAAFVVASTCLFGLFAAQLMLVAAALGIALDPLTAWGALGLSITAGALSLLPFGLGATDVVLVALLTVAGVPALEAGAMALGYRLVSTLPLSLAGAVSYAVLTAGGPYGQAERDGR